jgi:hypothetical protein
MFHLEVKMTITFINHRWVVLHAFVCDAFCTVYLLTLTLQLRIRVECAFGQFVSRWGILRCAISSKITIKKVIALVNCLAKLHNFCIDESEPGAPEESPTDMMNMLSNRDGYVRMERSSNGTPLAPRGLMHGGQHFNDVPRDVRRRWTSEANDTGSSLLLPRQTMLRKVIDSHKVRPHVNCRQSQKK